MLNQITLNQQRKSSWDTKGKKKREYKRRVLEIEHGAVTPLVFGSNGAMGKECIINKTLAMKIANKQDKSYSTVMSWIRTNLNIL